MHINKFVDQQYGSTTQIVVSGPTSTSGVIPNRQRGSRQLYHSLIDIGRRIFGWKYSDIWMKIFKYLIFTGLPTLVKVLIVDLRLFSYCGATNQSFDNVEPAGSIRVGRVISSEAWLKVVQIGKTSNDILARSQKSSLKVDWTNISATL